MRRYWIGFAIVIVASFAVLGWVGTRIYQQAPPLPFRVVTTEGTVLLTTEDITKGQNVWQAMGGMETGSVWGHGSYVAPDWTADWLHRESMFILDSWSQESSGKPFSSLSAQEQAPLQSRLQTMMKKNTYSSSTGILTLDPIRAKAFEANAAYYAGVFVNGLSVRRKALGWAARETVFRRIRDRSGNGLSRYDPISRSFYAKEQRLRLSRRGPPDVSGRIAA